MADDHKELWDEVIRHVGILVICIVLIWWIVEEAYHERGYSAPVPEVRFDHDCINPPDFLLRAVIENERPKDLALFVRVENFDSISSECGFIDLFLIPHGSMAVTTDFIANRLSDTPYFRTFDGRGFALRFLMNGTGQHTPVIGFSDAVHRRSIEHSYFWLHFATAQRAEKLAGTLTVEFSPSANFLIDSLKMRNGAVGSVFGDQAEIQLTAGQGFVVDLRDSGGESGFALLNILIGAFATIGTGSFTGLFKLCIRLLRKD